MNTNRRPSHVRAYQPFLFQFPREAVFFFKKKVWTQYLKIGRYAPTWDGRRYYVHVATPNSRDCYSTVLQTTLELWEKNLVWILWKNTPRSWLTCAELSFIMPHRFSQRDSFNFTKRLRELFFLRPPLVSSPVTSFPSTSDLSASIQLHWGNNYNIQCSYSLKKIRSSLFTVETMRFVR